MAGSSMYVGDICDFIFNIFANYPYQWAYGGNIKSKSADGKELVFAAP